LQWAKLSIDTTEPFSSGSDRPRRVAVSLDEWGRASASGFALPGSSADRYDLVMQLATGHRLRGVTSPCSELHAPPTSRF
jgi:hypothetical protein